MTKKPYTIFNLKDGDSPITELLFIPKPKSGLFYFNITVQVGSAYNYGIDAMSDVTEYAHFLEHLQAYYPSSKYPVETENDKFIKARGIIGNAFTADDRTEYYQYGQIKFMNDTIDMMLASFIDFKPSIDSFKREQSAVAVELNMRCTEQSRNGNLMGKKLFGEHPNNLSTDKRLANVKSTTLSDLIEYRNRTYKTSRMFFTLAADIPEADIDKTIQPFLEMINNIYKSVDCKIKQIAHNPNDSIQYQFYHDIKWDYGTTAPIWIHANVFTTEKDHYTLIKSSPDTKYSYVLNYMKFYQIPEDEDIHSLKYNLINLWVGKCLNHILFKILRTDYKLVYYADCSLSIDKKHRIWVLNIETTLDDPRKQGQVFELIDKIISDLINVGSVVKSTEFINDNLIKSIEEQIATSIQVIKHEKSFEDDVEWYHNQLWKWYSLAQDTEHKDYRINQIRNKKVKRLISKTDYFGELVKGNLKDLIGDSQNLFITKPKKFIIVNT